MKKKSLSRFPKIQVLSHSAFPIYTDRMSTFRSPFWKNKTSKSEVTKCHTFSTVVSSTNSLSSPQWSPSLESYLSMFFFPSQDEHCCSKCRKNVKRKGYLFPRGGNVHRFVTIAILSIKIFPTYAKMTSWQGTFWPWEQNPIWVHYLVTNSFVFWWKLR